MRGGEGGGRFWGGGGVRTILRLSDTSSIFLLKIGGGGIKGRESVSPEKKQLSYAGNYGGEVVGGWVWERGK